jgi:uncharacterized protein YndB with AHSA1/START domain
MSRSYAIPVVTPITVSRSIRASASRVFDAWLDEKNAAKWLFATPTGSMLRVEIDPHVGGAFCIVERRPEGDVEHFGTYLEIERPHRLVFTFGVEHHIRDVTMVSIDIAAEGDVSEIVLTHEGVLREDVARTAQGWGNILDALAALLENPAS